MIELVELDLTKTGGNGQYATQCHPDIKPGIQYLCLIGGTYFAGNFQEVWYGLNFLGWDNEVGLQYDAPGTNSSRWERIWEIREAKAIDHSKPNEVQETFVLELKSLMEKYGAILTVYGRQPELLFEFAENTENEHQFSVMISGHEIKL